jgi:Protein of unknown function (DUF2568)
MLQIANLALKFVLELCALASVVYWGWHQGSDQLPLQLLFSVGAAAVFIACWGIFLAPTARRGLSSLQKNMIGAVVLLVAAAALAWAGQSVLALIFAIAIVVNAVLLFVFRDQPVPAVVEPARG